MAGFLENTSLGILRRALDGLSLRQHVISNNLANLDTPGFKAGEVVFERALRRALDGNAGPAQGEAQGALSPASTHARHFGGEAAGERPEIITLDGAARADGNTVDVDREMSRLAETQIAYSVAAKLVNTKLALLRSIVNDGRR